MQPQGSIHNDLWYVSEREDMPIDDCCWIVLPNYTVARGIPVSDPIHGPSTLEELARNPIRRTKARINKANPLGYRQGPDYESKR
jgi:hypothetical protein